MSERRGWQSTEAVLVGLQELAAGRERAVVAGGEAGNICGDVGEDNWRGLVVVVDLKQKQHERLDVYHQFLCASSGLVCSQVCCNREGKPGDSQDERGAPR